MGREVSEVKRKDKEKRIVTWTGLTAVGL